MPSAFNQLKEKLGFAPYPGTLNIKPRPEHLKNLTLLRKYLDGGIAILPPKGSTYCVGICFRARFEGFERAALVIPLVKDYYEDVIEILAPIELKERFGLKEGDPVSVDVEVPLKKLTGLKAVILDLDGTIFNNVELFLRSFNMALEDFRLKTVPAERLKRSLNVGRNLSEILFEHVPTYLVSKLYARINMIYGGMMKEMRPFKGVKEALKSVKSRNIKTGLATGSKIGHEELKALLERHDILEYFDKVVTGIDVEKGKPYPDLVRKCAKRLEVGKETSPTLAMPR